MKSRSNKKLRLKRLQNRRRKLPRTRPLKKRQLPQLIPKKRHPLMLRSKKLNQHQRNKNRHLPQLQHLLQLNSQSQPSRKSKLLLQQLLQRRKKPQNNLKSR